MRSNCNFVPKTKRLIVVDKGSLKYFSRVLLTHRHKQTPRYWNLENIQIHPWRIFKILFEVSFQIKNSNEISSLFFISGSLRNTNIYVASSCLRYFWWHLSIVKNELSLIREQDRDNLQYLKWVHPSDKSLSPPPLKIQAYLFSSNTIYQLSVPVTLCSLVLKTPVM